MCILISSTKKIYLDIFIFISARIQPEININLLKVPVIFTPFSQNFQFDRQILI